MKKIGSTLLAAARAMFGIEDLHPSQLSRESRRLAHRVYGEQVHRQRANPAGTKLAKKAAKGTLTLKWGQPGGAAR